MRSKATAIEEVKAIVQSELSGLDDEQSAVFQRYGVEPYLASILRCGEMDNVVIVARREGEVIYWEDVEEGFNVSPVGDDGRILHHWCNQDELGLALNSWIEGRQGPPKLGPAVPIE
jgi:hypothetical protein